MQNPFSPLREGVGEGVPSTLNSYTIETGVTIGDTAVTMGIALGETGHGDISVMSITPHHKIPAQNS